MLIKINKIGKSKVSNWCTFQAQINEFLTIVGIANYVSDLDLEEDTTYKDLHLNIYKTKKGNFVFTIFK